MNKYDFGYNVVPGSTMEWAYNAITEHSRVLEVGPAIGTLTKNLTENKSCIVDIVELDYDSGKMASVFANISCIGNEEGDLEKEYWYQRLKSELQYDYIVVLDVLEHLHYPTALLKKLKSLLLNDGEILVSIPNIAHNSVLINLLNNRFNYTTVGLLDNTHLHFFTYESIIEMLDECNLIANKKSCIQISVSDNEIKNNYYEVPIEIEEYLRTRPLADVYQFLFHIQLKKQSDLIKEIFYVPNLLTTLYKMEIYDKNNNLLSSRGINPHKVEEIIYFDNESSEEFRICLCDKPCIISELSIYANGQKTEMIIYESNGVRLINEWTFFIDLPQIIMQITENIRSINLNYKCSFIGSDVINLMAPSIQELIVMKNNVELLKKEVECTINEIKIKDSLWEEEENKYNDIILKNKEEIEDLKSKYKEEIESLNQEKESLNQEIEIYKKSILYRIKNKLIRCFFKP